jgi:hypothetical protein
MTYSILAPFTSFFDAAGIALENGKIYIGAVDQDPETNPIVVYWDADGIIEAEQPIRTINGYPAYNGSPAAIFVNSDYSIRVRTKNDVVVYYSPKGNSVAEALTFAADLQQYKDAVAASAGSSLVGFIQSGTGAIATTALLKMRQFVNVFDFMSLAQIADVKAGTALVDCQSAITNALNASANSVLIVPPGTYLLNTAANVNAALVCPANRVIQAYGATFKVGSALNKSIIGFLISDTTYMVGVKNVHISGLKIDGNRDNRTGGAQSGYGFFISACDGVILLDCSAINTTADGVAVVGNLTFVGGLSNNVVMYNMFCDNNYRNGLSLDGTRAFRSYGGLFTNTNGASPQAGIDVEPDDANTLNIDFAFYSPRCGGNAGNGISVFGPDTDSTGIFSYPTSQGNAGYGFQSVNDGIAVKLIGLNGGANTLGDIGGIAVDLSPKAICVFEGDGTPPTLRLGANIVAAGIDRISTGYFRLTWLKPLPENWYVSDLSARLNGVDNSAIGIHPTYTPNPDYLDILCVSSGAVVYNPTLITVEIT